MRALVKMSGLGSVMKLLNQICLKVLPHLLCAMVIIYVVILFLVFQQIYIETSLIINFTLWSSIGDTVVFVCSGIAIECQEHITRFLTSASLVTPFFNTEKDKDDLKVGSDNHPLFICLFKKLWSLCFLSLPYHCRLKCTLKTKYTTGSWMNMI